MHRFTRALIAFRKRHPSICRGRFWRDDVEWLGAHGPIDLSANTRAFAYFLRGASEQDADLYVMLNMGTTDVAMTIQRGKDSEWRRIVDTSLEPPHEIADEDRAAPVDAGPYLVRPRSVVVLLRRA